MSGNSISNGKLTEQDYIDVSNEYGIEVAVIKAVVKVETGGRGGFVAENKPAILFEGHIFWRQLKKHGIDPESVSNTMNKDILYPSATRSYYVGGIKEYSRLERAEKINKDAALESASWGLFQVMGYHWKSLGFNSVEDYVDFVSKNEKNQLIVFCKFITVNNLVRYLKTKNWAAFAKGYNGPGYKTYSYDTKLAKYYAQYSKTASAE